MDRPEVADHRVEEDGIGIGVVGVLESIPEARPGLGFEGLLGVEPGQPVEEP